jgi:hypothetical protein
MQESLFYTFHLKDYVPPDHLLRCIDRFVGCSTLRQHLASFYSTTGRPSIDPELMTGARSARGCGLGDDAISSVLWSSASRLPMMLSG